LPIDINSIQSFTPQQMIAIIDQGIAYCALNQEWSHNGKLFRRADIPKLMEARALYLELAAVSASSTGELTALIQLGDPSYPNDQGPGAR
jgi:hypothetical protein